MLLLIIGIASVCGLNLTTNHNLVIYWGQNSYGSAHRQQPELWEKDLKEYCRQDDVDVIAISFLNVFNAGRGMLPEINFANHCEDKFDAPQASNLLKCPKIGEDIKFCQSMGKTVLLSLGGAIASTGIPTPEAGTEFATTLWNLFMEGTHRFRPFGDAVVDGIDLDLEGGSQDNYPFFLNKLQELYNSSPRKFYVTAAPQCDFPDRNLQTIMETTHLDAVFIQFYNNFCGANNYHNPHAWNWPTWAAWAATRSYNPNVKLFFGVPASKTAAGIGYVGLDRLRPIVSSLRNYAMFGGVMLWDASQSENNLRYGKPFSHHIKELLLEGGDYNPVPTPSPTTTPTSSTTTAPTSSPTTTSTKTSSTTTAPTNIDHHCPYDNNLLPPTHRKITGGRRTVCWGKYL
ncbi:Chitinase 2 [Massospora cicadina]|nr:Chitinase 2 [Massospora cicadina]